MHDAVRMLGQKAALDPHFFAFALAALARLEDLPDDAALAARLGCAPDTLIHLQLVPRPTGADIAPRATALAARFGADANALMAAARAGELAERNRPPTDESELPAAGYIVAARDRKPT